MNFSKSIEIEASPKQVWEVMQDFSTWPDWTPTITKIEPLGIKSTGVGTRLRIEQPKLPPSVYIIIAWTDYEGFAMIKGNWFLKVTLLHELKSTPKGTQVVLSVDFSGLFASTAARRYGALMEEYLSLEANGLKKQSESYSLHI